MGKNISLKNILITGGAGFIGSDLAFKLVDLGCHVTILDSLSEQIHGKNPKNSEALKNLFSKTNFIKGDITDRESVEKAIQNQDAIIHLAAETGTGQSMYEIEKYNYVNVYGTALLMDVLVNKKNSVKKFILASSRAVYGEGKYQNENSEVVFPDHRNVELMEKGIFEMTDEKGKILENLPTDENSKLRPVSFYGLTKLQQEQIVENICRSIQLNFVILRYQNVYGVGQSLKNPYTGILSIFSTQILNGENLNIFEDGLPTRDFVNIDDTVEATVRALEKDLANNQIINVGTGIGTTVLNVAENLVKKYKKNTAINISGDFRIGDIRHNVASLKKMKELLDFEPKVGFENGLDHFSDWVLMQPIEENLLSKSLKEMQEKGFLKS